MDKITENEFRALISLLDDPDEEVIYHVSNRLKDLGIHGVEKLENAWEYTGDELRQSRLEDLINDIQFDRLKSELIKWRDKDSEDLLLGAILVAKFKYPDLDESLIYSTVDRLTQAIWLELNNGLTPLEEIHVFNNVFYKLTGYIGEQDGFSKPDLGYINKVLELKKGNSQALGILYLVLCKELNLPVFGIGLPYYFILAYVKNGFTNEDIPEIKKRDISFYINPVNEGTVFQSKQIGEYLKQMDVRPKPSHYLPYNNIEILRSLIYHIFMCYEQKGDVNHAAKMKELYDLLVEEE